MYKFKFTRMWDVIYPIGMYYTIQLIVMYATEFTFPAVHQNPLVLQFVSTLITLPFLYFMFYAPDQKLLFGGETVKRNALFLLSLLSLLTGGFFSIGLNHIIGILRLEQLSASYAQVQTSFFSGNLFLEILALCIVIPLAEEFLYRGIVFRRLTMIFGPKVSIITSAVIFGLVHVNLVQFVYATVFGILLAYLYSRTNTILVPIVMHMIANFISVIRAETNITKAWDNHFLFLSITALIFLGLSAVLVLIIKKMTKVD